MIPPSKITELRRALGMTQGDLAHLVGVHSMTISKWERGTLDPTPHQAVLLLAARTAVDRSPSIGIHVGAAMMERGIAYALFVLLRAAFD